MYKCDLVYFHEKIKCDFYVHHVTKISDHKIYMDTVAHLHDYRKKIFNSITVVHDPVLAVFEEISDQFHKIFGMQMYFPVFNLFIILRTKIFVNLI